MFDKTKFIRCHGDSEGFGLDVHVVDTDGKRHNFVGYVNPRGWQEVDGVKLPSVHAWADANGTAHAGDHLAQPQTFDGETGTYSDPKCCTCDAEAVEAAMRAGDAAYDFWMRQGRHH